MLGKGHYQDNCVCPGAVPTSPGGGWRGQAAVDRTGALPPALRVPVTGLVGLAPAGFSQLAYDLCTGCLHGQTAYPTFEELLPPPSAPLTVLDVSPLAPLCPHGHTVLAFLRALAQPLLL